MYEYEYIERIYAYYISQSTTKGNLIIFLSNETEYQSPYTFANT